MLLEFQSPWEEYAAGLLSSYEIQNAVYSHPEWLERSGASGRNVTVSCACG